MLEMNFYEYVRLGSISVKGHVLHSLWIGFNAHSLYVRTNGHDLDHFLDLIWVPIDAAEINSSALDKVPKHISSFGHWSGR